MVTAALINLILKLDPFHFFTLKVKTACWHIILERNQNNSDLNETKNLELLGDLCGVFGYDVRV